MRAVKQPRALETREKILHAASRLFALKRKWSAAARAANGVASSAT
jgi:hypothetical protein